VGFTANACPEWHAAPLLRHSCAELASAQHAIPGRRVFHPAEGAAKR